jgi:hypothetical protein
MKLNTKKIEQELTRLEWTHTKYAKELGISKQLLQYYMKPDLKGVQIAEKLAGPLNLDPKDLLI